MNRFFLESHLFSDKWVKFPEDIAHQVLNVLRLRSGDQVEVLDNTGNLYCVSLEFNTDKKCVSGRIISKEKVITEPMTHINLCFGLSNREKVEWILQKGTEVGISAFSPFISSRTLVQSTSLTDKKLTRWERIIKEAAEQSHRGRLPQLNAPQDFEICLQNHCGNDLVSLIAWEEESPVQSKVKELLDGFAGSLINLFIGPEGGFSIEEIQSAKKADCQVVSLGPRILRMETAAIIFPALVLYELGDL